MSFTNKAYAFGRSENNDEEMANSMQVFLLITLHGKKHRINLCSKHVCNVKSEFLQLILNECLDKSANSDFEIVPIILDSASIDCKLMRSLLTLEKVNPKTPMPKMVYSTFFVRNNKKTFCTILNHAHNQMHEKQFSEKNNHITHPKLVLSDGNILEPGTCAMKWTKDLYHKNKQKLKKSVRINRNAFNPESLSKQKVKPALASFSTELMQAL